MIYVILGTHKSGTSLVSENLHSTGIPMVEHVQDGDYDSGNKWERIEASALNNSLRADADSNSLDLEPPPPGRLESDEARQATLRIIESQTSNDWGFKDPRTCLTWPLWNSAMPDARIVGVYRHYRPVVARHLRRGPAHHRKGLIWPLRIARLSVRRWCEHNRIVMDAVRSAEGRSILLSYDRLMNGQEEFERLEHFLGRQPKDCREIRKREIHAPSEVLARVAARLVRWSGPEDPFSTLRQLEELRVSMINRLC